MNKISAGKRELNRAAFALLIGIVTLFVPALCRAQGYTITTVAGGAGVGAGYVNGAPATSVYIIPAGVAVDAAGNLYIANYNVISKVTAGGAISTIAGSPSLVGYSGDGGQATSAGLTGPLAVAVDAAGNLYIADTGDDRIRLVTPEGVISTVAGGGTGCAQQTDSLGDGCPATSAEVSFPCGLALDAAGNLYIAESTPVNRIRKLAPSGTITTVAGAGYMGSLGDGGPAISAYLSLGAAEAVGVALDSAGNIYIADPGHNRIRKVTVNGIISTVAGSSSGSYSGDGGPATSAGLNGPTGVVVDAGGNLYIADTGDQRIRKVTASGTITTIAGNGDVGSTGDDGPATSATLSGPSSIALGNGGDIFVSDHLVNYASTSDDNRIRLLTPATGSQAPAVAGVQNAEGGSVTIAPNTWVAIEGSGLAPLGDTRIWEGSDFVNNQMPTQLDGVGVTMNGENAYVYYISPAQVNVLTPPDLATGPVQVKVTSGGVTSASFAAQAQQESLSFFIFGAGPYVVGTHSNGSDLGPTNLYPGLTTPAAPGEVVTLYANGFGPVSPPVVKGADAQSGDLPSLPVIQIGGFTAAVQFAGIVSPGLYQFNVVVPSLAPDGDNPITAQYNRLTTQSGVLLTVQH